MLTYKRTCVKLLRTLNRNSSTVSNEYSKTPQYPSILDTSPKESRRRELAKKHEKYNSLHTVEEKLFALNMDKYYGWNCMILKEHAYPYQFLPFAQFLTRTVVVEDNKDLFHKVQNVDINECKVNADKIRKHLQEEILFVLNEKRKFREICTKADNQDASNKDVIETINSTLISYLSAQYPHLLHSMIDYEPRLEAFWMVGSFQPTEDKCNKNDNNNEDTPDLENHWIQYFGAPIIQLRNHLPLTQLDTQHLTSYNDSEKLPQIPVANSDPTLTYGIQIARRHGTTIPGYWPGDENEFGLLSYHNGTYLLDRPPHFGVEEHNDTLIAQAILSSFAWLHGQASYQGFSTFTDLTYPLVTQNVISDGRRFTFSLYQLNTTLLHSEHSLNNPRVNVCLTMPTSQLYQEIRGNEFIGWNDDVVSTLLSFYLNIPKRREGLNLKPFLNSEEKYLADIEDDDRRCFLHNQFRHLFSNRPRNRLPYEIYDWERIYKIKFPSRQFDARLRPFELDANPLEDRKVNEHLPKFIPKKFRPKKKHWAGWRGRHERTYFPDV